MELQKAKLHIVTVFMPDNTDHTPYLIPVIGDSEISGRNLVLGLWFMNPLFISAVLRMAAY